MLVRPISTRFAIVRHFLLLPLVLICAVNDISGQDLVPVAGKKDQQWDGLETLPPPLMTPSTSDQSPEVETIQGELSTQEVGGESELIRQRYPDGNTQITRRVVQDSRGNYLNHGPWKLYNRQGQVMAEGRFEHGRMVGAWQRWHPTDSGGLFSEVPFNSFQGPFLSMASFTMGKLDGTGTIYDRLRRKILEMSYSQGQRHGTATWYWPNGQKMRQAQFNRGELHGELVEWSRENNELRRVGYRDGRELITRRTWHRRDQKQTEDEYLGPQLEFDGEDDWWNARPANYLMDGAEVQHGISQTWFPNGQIMMQGQYEDGLRQGEFTWWHESGQKQIVGRFMDDQKQGLWTWWHENGVKAIQGNYTDDQAQGIWTWWDETGQIEREEDLSALVAPGELESINSFDFESDN